MPTTQHYYVFDSRAGHCAIAWNGRGVIRFQLPTGGADETERLLLQRLPMAEAASPPPDIAAVIASVRRYFEGAETRFTSVAVDLGEQDDFFQRVYDAVRQVGWGQSTTYGSLAKALGAGPEAARDVGQAMAKNPVPLIIPCHRVLAAGGKIGGFSAPGGPETKRRMLALEGIDVAPEKPVQQSFGF
jgi:methylated-DNA-[protein]-cysteine S-methyltransferase